MRVLVAEDDLTVAAGLELLLKSAGIVSDRADNGEEALELARHYDYDLVILALNLLDMDGSEVVRRMRTGRIDTPVIGLAGVNKAALRVQALQAGADDVVTKPLDKAELLARVSAVVRRDKGFSQASLRVGPLSLDLDSHEVNVQERRLSLTGKEYSLLELLVLRRGMVVTKEAFLNHLYGGMDEPEAKIIDVFVCKLRRKLAEAGASDLIGTVWGRGYMIRAGTEADRNAPGQAEVGALLEAA